MTNEFNVILRLVCCRVPLANKAVTWDVVKPWQDAAGDCRAQLHHITLDVEANRRRTFPRHENPEQIIEDRSSGQDFILARRWDLRWFLAAPPHSMAAKSGGNTPPMAPGGHEDNSTDSLSYE